MQYNKTNTNKTTLPLSSLVSRNNIAHFRAMFVKNPFKPESGSRRFLSPTKARRLSFCIIIAVALGAVGLLFIDNKKGKNYLKTSTSIQKNSNDNIILASSSGTTDIQHRPSKQGGDAVGSSNKEEGGEEPQLSAAVDKFEMTGTSDVHIYYII
eukprot:scaffold659_cov75-Skeletonema_dohrnii-CCMP3373.AAC.2